MAAKRLNFFKMHSLQYSYSRHMTLAGYISAKLSPKLVLLYHNKGIAPTISTPRSNGCYSASTKEKSMVASSRLTFSTLTSTMSPKR